MAQFGKHLFGTSLFGESNSFVGTYDTRVVDAGEDFDGSITVNLKNKLPSVSYKHDKIISIGKKSEYDESDKKEKPMFFYEGSINQTEKHTTLSPGATAFVYLSGKNIKVVHGAGKATISVKEEKTEEVREYTTNNTGVLELENFPNNELRNYLITITAIEAFEFIQLDVLTTEIQGLVRATTEEMGKTDYFLKGDWPLAFQTNAMKEHDKHWIYSHKLDFVIKDNILTAETDSFMNVRYIQVKLILLTTDEDTSPEVSEIQFYSGDLSKHRERGRWQTTLDMSNIASANSTEFKKVKKVEWIEHEEEQSVFDLYSSSRNGSTPSDINIRDDNYWSDLTAKYILKHDGINQGIPYGRISLKERGNGFNESSRNGSIKIGPINVLNFGFTNTKINKWNLFSGLYFYPRNSNQSKIYIEFFEKKNDDRNGIPPLYVIDNPETYKDYLININNKYDNLYAKITFERSSGVSTPVFDMFDLEANLDYRSPRNLNNYTTQLSALDGHERNNKIGKGKKHVVTINKNKFDWPNRSQNLEANKKNIEESNKNLALTFKPKYLNQVYLGIENTDNTELNFTKNYPNEYRIYSQVYAEEPSASVNEVDKNKLYWHYSYDGGTVNFPIETKRQLSTQFTPLLLEDKRYRYKLSNGWSDETFKVPYAMTLNEIADITINKVEELKKVNKNVPLYENKVLAGYEITLPNKSFNKLVNLEFEKTRDVVTDYSILNNVENDFIKAWINKSDNYKYTEWTSDEVLFSGIINYNDKEQPYLRTQNSVYNVMQKGNHFVSTEKETALEIATRYNVNLEDLLILNNKKEVFDRNEVVVIPGGYSLPDIEPGLIFEGEHPYKIEIVPGSVRRTKGNIRLSSDILKPGSDDEESISYTLTESDTETIYIKRGNVANGRDRIPVANVMKIHSISSRDGRTTYTKATSSMGDYLLKENHIDWSPTFRHSKEPNAGDFYAVTLTRGVVDNLRIVYSSDYIERMSQDRMEAIPIIENKEYKMDLIEDQVIKLKTLDEMKEMYPELNNLRYVVENSDLWVNTEVDKNEIKVTMNGEDPNINWYPTINTGFYYLNDKEHYLYSEPLETVFDDKDIPIIENVVYTENGLRAPK